MGTQMKRANLHDFYWILEKDRFHYILNWDKIWFAFQISTFLNHKMHSNSLNGAILTFKTQGRRVFQIEHFWLQKTGMLII